MANDYEAFRNRFSQPLRVWRKAVLEAAGGRCDGCGVYYRRLKLTLQAHHLRGLAWLDESTVVDPANGVALCTRCRRDFRLRFPDPKCTPEQYVEWQLVRWNRVVGPCDCIDCSIAGEPCH